MLGMGETVDRGGKGLPAYTDILAWSRTRPRWQQDALRRFVLDSWETDDVETCRGLVEAPAVRVPTKPQLTT